ncbi:MAG: hypothetical protein IJ800_00830 [Clostridia bacterium]|nr:hypothetical protein [Clostridia bacterium]
MGKKLSIAITGFLAALSIFALGACSTSKSAETGKTKDETTETASNDDQKETGNIEQEDISEKDDEISKYYIPDDQSADVIEMEYEIPETSSEITSVDQFKTIEGSSESFYLTRDLDFAGVEDWSPIENFRGKLFGNGYSVKNFSSSIYNGNIGLFATLYGEINQLVFENVSISSEAYDEVKIGVVCCELKGILNNVVVKSGEIRAYSGRVGGIVGLMSGGKIENCVNRADIISQATENAHSIGGIAGMFSDGQIINSKNAGNLSKKYYAGGIVGVATCENIISCLNYGEVVGEYDTAGIVGLLQKQGNITFGVDNINLGNITGKQNVGGIIGRFYDTIYSSSQYTVNLNRLTNVGEIVGEKYVGGIAGYLYGTNTWSSSYKIKMSGTALSNDGDISGVSYVGGLIGYADFDNSESKISDSVSSGNISAEYMIGGLAGRLNNIIVDNCKNDGTHIKVTGYYADGNEYYAYTGGYVGSGFVVKNCDNAVEINYTSIGGRIGGIIGCASGDIINCSNTANITAEQSKRVGGVIGESVLSGSGSLTNLSNSGKIKGNNCVGGIIGRFYDTIYSSSQYTVNLNRLTNVGEIVGGNYVGGIAGYLYGTNTWSSSYKIKMSASGLTNESNITASNYVGGLIGYVNFDGESVIAPDRIQTGEAIGSGENVGDMVGYYNNLKL